VPLPAPAGHHVGMTAIVRAPFCHGKLGVAGLGSTRLGSRPRRLDLVEHRLRGRIRMPAREPRITDRRSARCRTAGADRRLSPACHNPGLSGAFNRLRALAARRGLQHQSPDPRICWRWTGPAPVRGWSRLSRNWRRRCSTATLAGPLRWWADTGTSTKLEPEPAPVEVGRLTGRSQGGSACPCR
jgi:hypothetical protein